ncbi:MAG: 5'-methylthioadenosine nucleosidase [Mycoplasmataceae bacterium]|nr:5'-methylthioadenosine nucleosidase [Mycoplasmataceae bacterium]
MLGIIIADSNELKKFEFELLETKVSNQFTFHKYKVYDHEVVVVHSGIGIANAAAATQALITLYEIDGIYNYGAVGADNALKVFDVIIPERIYYHDVMTPWYDVGQTPGEKKFFTNALPQDGLHKNLGSGSSFIESQELVDKVHEFLDVNIFDMESAAIAQIADKNDIPLYTIKCVSDSINVDGTLITDINERISKAGRIAFDKMIEYIKNH